jgi:hypothetical protein
LQQINAFPGSVLWQWLFHRNPEQNFTSDLVCVAHQHNVSVILGGLLSSTLQWPAGQLPSNYTDWVTYTQLISNVMFAYAFDGVSYSVPPAILARPGPHDRQRLLSLLNGTRTAPHPAQQQQIPHARIVRNVYTRWIELDWHMHARTAVSYDIVHGSFGTQSLAIPAASSGYGAKAVRTVK